MNKMIWGVCVSGLVAGCISEPDAMTGDDETAEVAQDIAGGSPYGRLVSYGGRCLDVFGNGNADRTPIQIYGCNNGVNQGWSIPMGVPGPFGSQATGKVMDAPYTTDYSTTWLFGWWGGANQIWSMPSVEVHGVGNCLDVPYTSDGSIVWMFQCWGGANQKWFYNRNTAELKTSDGRCLEYIQAQTHAPVLAGTCTGGGNQKWYTGSSGVFSTGAGYCLDIPDASTANRTALQLYPCNFGAAQKFSIKGAIVGQQSNKCLQLHSTSSGIDTYDHSQPELFTCNGTPQQQWEFQW